MKKHISLLLCAVLIFSACGKSFGDIDEVPETEATSSIGDLVDCLANRFGEARIDGSTSMTPLHKLLDLKFGGGEYVYHSQTVPAFEKFINGEADILLSVDYTDGYFKKARAAGMDLGRYAITREAFVFLINKDNPVKSLTTEQIKDIYGGKITNWAQVGGDDAPINAFQRNSDSGSQMRMVKFMDGAELMSVNVTYYNGMTDIIKVIDNYDTGKYSIAYNMYAFTENQYPSENVVMLGVNGVHPTDATIYDDSYPLVIYNYMYYDKNSAFAAEFAANLYAYLMSDSGQKAIAEAGYVNLNPGFDRNKSGYDLYHPGYDYEIEGESYISRYDADKGEFYAVEKGWSSVLEVYYNYPDYVLRHSDYVNNKKARKFIELVFKKFGYSERSGAYLDSDSGTVVLSVYSPYESVRNIKYDGKFYQFMSYSIEDDNYTLRSVDSYDLNVIIKQKDLKNLYYRKGPDDDPEYYRPFA